MMERMQMLSGSAEVLICCLRSASGAILFGGPRVGMQMMSKVNNCVEREIQFHCSACCCWIG